MVKRTKKALAEFLLVCMMISNVFPAYADNTEIPAETEVTEAVPEMIPEQLEIVGELFEAEEVCEAAEAVEAEIWGEGTGGPAESIDAKKTEAGKELLGNTAAGTWENLKKALAGDITESVQDQLEITGSDGGTTIKLLTDFTAGGSDASLSVSGTKILDLNGHVINGAGKVGSVITVESGANLTLTDNSEGTAHKFKVGENGRWVLDEQNGTETVTGGIITGGDALTGAGVFVSGTLNMTGGTICGNNANNGGGGVYVGNGEFIMEGGKISGNMAEQKMTGYSAYGGGVYVKNGKFTMNGGTISDNEAITASTEEGTFGGGVYVENNAAFTLNGGNISNNKSQAGGGVSVWESSFTMTGGCIADNTAFHGARGGGVHTGGNNGDVNFVMTGGSIVNNTAVADGVDAYGGGIWADENAAIVFGGTAVVRGNSSTGAGDTIDESNVHLQAYKSQAMVTISTESPLSTGAEIGLTVWKGSEDTWGPGKLAGTYFASGLTEGNMRFFFMNDCGGPYANQGTIYNIEKREADFILCGTYKVTVNAGANGTVTSDKVYYVGGGNGATVTLTVKPDEGYQLKADSLRATYENDGTHELDLTPGLNGTYTFIMPAYPVKVTAEFISSWAALQAEIIAAGTDPKTIILTEDLISEPGDNRLLIDDGQNITLNLNGFNIIKDSKESGGGNCITVNGDAELTIKDESATTHKFKVGDDGLWTLDPSGDKTLTGGCIMGINPDEETNYDGIGVFINSRATLNLYGGNIVGNKAGRWGGGVMVCENAVFNMYGGTVTGNTAGANGGGVFADGALNLYGGSITENKLTDGTTANNVYLKDGEYITIGNGCKANAGVTTETAPTEGNAVKLTTNGDAEDTVLFTSDKTGYIVAYNANGYLELQKPAEKTFSGITITTPPEKTAYKEGEPFDSTGMIVTAMYTDGSSKVVTGYSVMPSGALSVSDTTVSISYTEDEITKTATQTVTVSEAPQKYYTVGFETFGGTPVPEAQTVRENGKATRPQIEPSKEGYTFGGWYRDETCTDAWNFALDTVIDDMTLYPKWIKNEEKKASIGGNVTEDGAAVPGAVVELFLGKDKVAATVTDANGSYKFDDVKLGAYNIVVTKENGKTKTELVTVNKTGGLSADVKLPKGNVSSKVEHREGDVVPDAKSDISQTVVGGLDEIAEKETPSGTDKITIKLKIEPKADKGTKEQKDIRENAGEGKKVEFLDLSLFKQVNDGKEEDIGDKNDTLLTIVIPFDFTNVEISSVMILRNHGGKVEKITTSRNDKGEYLTKDYAEGMLTIHAKKFSDYAIAYSEVTAPDPSDGGSGESQITAYAEPVANATAVSGNWLYKEAEDTWYYIAGGSYLKNGWYYLGNPYSKTVKTGWFCFDEAGRMQRGWILSKLGHWFFTHDIKDGDLGRLERGWHKDEQDGLSYYLDLQTGRMYTGRHVIDGVEYYFTEASVNTSWCQDEKGRWVVTGVIGTPLGSLQK